MAVEWKYRDESKKQVLLPNGKPKSLLKVTGTRFAGILGLNPWSTPFQMWCEITKAARKPFEGNVYTEAGNIIEPKVIQWYKDNIYDRTMSPEEYFGMRYRNIKYDFYPEQKVYGGMWDAAMIKRDGKTIRALGEIKTTKRSQDWQEGPPIYYLLQVLLYAYLSGVNNVFISVCFLQEDDYNHPELFTPTDENTKVFNYDLETFRYYANIHGEAKEWSFFELLELADGWYKTYIETGVSPEFDEKVDADYLKILRKTSPKNDSTIDQVIEEINRLESVIDGIKKDKNLVDYEKRVKTLKDNLKSMLKAQMGENDTSIQVMNFKYSQNSSKTVVDEKKLKADGLFDKYSIEKPGTWTLRTVKVEESEDK